MTSTTQINPFLSGNFAPIHTEIATENLTIIGQLPAELNGTFFRIGPNPQYSPIGQYHWFDGDGMIHAVRLDNGQASYRNRWVRTKGFELERAEDQAIWPGLLGVPRFDRPHGMMSKNVANTALVWSAGKLLALWEGGEPHIIDPVSLETLGTQTFDGQLTSAFTAHPKVDPETGETFFFGYGFTPPFITYGVISPSGKIVKTEAIDLPMPVLMHDFAITDKHAIFLDMPLTVDGSRYEKGEPPIFFDASRSSRFGILPRDGNGSDIRWFDVPSCMIYHVTNAYEDGNTVVLYAHRKNATSMLVADNELDTDRAYLTCWRFNLDTGDVSETRLDDKPSEFPQVDPRFVGRKTRYAFAAVDATEHVPEPLFGGLVKYDLETGDRQVYAFGDGRYGGEVGFAPKRGSEAEADGWLLVYVHDTIADQSELLVLSANDLTAEPIARVILPQRVPYGFHAIWIGADRLTA